MKRTKRKIEYNTPNELELIKAAKSAYQKQYYATNKKKLLEKLKVYRKENPDKFKQYQKKYWAKFGTDAEIKKAKADYKKKYYAANKERIKPKQAQYMDKYWLRKAKEAENANKTLDVSN